MTDIPATDIKEALITRYNYEISPGKNKSKLTLFMGLSWVAVTNYVTIGKIITQGLSLRAGWRNMREEWTLLYEEHGKKLVFVDVRQGRPTPKPDIAPRHVPLIDYVSWQGRAMLKINDPDVHHIFVENNEVVTACDLPPVPQITKTQGWSALFRRTAGEIVLMDIFAPVIEAPAAPPAPAFRPMVFPLMLCAPKIAGLLPAPKITTPVIVPMPPTKPERAAKVRRFPRQLPTRSRIGENRYALVSELWMDLDRPQRHKLMNMCDPLIIDAIKYAKGRASLSTLSAEWDIFRKKLISIRSVASRDVTAAARSMDADSQYAKQFVQIESERAASLKQLVKDWLHVDINPTGGEYVGPTQTDGTRFTYQLEGIGDKHGLRVKLWSALIGANQISESIFTAEQAEPTIESLWRRYDKLTERLIAQTARRDTAVRNFTPDFKRQYSN